MKDKEDYPSKLTSFKNWLEMATINFGQHRGKDHTQLPSSYLQWMRDQMVKGNTNFGLSDKGRALSQPEVGSLLGQEIDKRGGKPASAPLTQAPTRIPTSTPTPEVRKDLKPVSQSNKSEHVWILAKSLAVRPEYNMPAVGLDLAMRKYDDTNWMFVILDPEEGRVVSRGTILTADLKNVVQSVKDEQGNLIKGEKPSALLKKIMPKKGKSGQMIPDDRITDEQKAIDEKFERMMKSPQQSHMMISANAGSGKTTLLKHLAWKYGQGKKWLYLVFNSKNKEEAKEEFPPTVKVETTNGWAGREVLGKNHINPTDRIQDYSDEDKASLVSDSQAFAAVMESLNLPNQNKVYGSDPKRLSGTERGLWYILRSLNKEFKIESLKLLGLAKAFAIDPRNVEEIEKRLQGVIDQYDLNSDMEQTKEGVTKNSPWAARYLDQLMGERFLSRDFSEELKKAAIWLLQQVMPHASQEEFTANKGQKIGKKHNLGLVRDFDDDVWFSAIHADELKWPKYEVVLVDEVQDFNIARIMILKKLADNGAKIVAVGDPNQAIYRFIGADSKAFSAIADTLRSVSHDKDIEHKLTKNFRSRKAIIDFANSEGAAKGHVSDLVQGRDFKVGPGKIGEGQATSGELEYDRSLEILRDEMRDMGEVKQTAILSRTTEPLVHASLNLMKNSIPFIILGKDIANDLMKHIDKIIGLFRLNNQSSVTELSSSINDYNTDQQDTHQGKAAMSGKLKELRETTEAMTAAINQFISETESEDANKPSGESISDFRKWLKSKFGGIDIDKSTKEYKKELEERNPVVLSTVHKSKGLQFQRVYMLRDDLWPHPRAKRAEDIEQENNNRYISITRPEDELHILKLKGQPGYKDPAELEDAA